VIWERAGVFNPGQIIEGSADVLLYANCCMHREGVILQFDFINLTGATRWPT